MIEIDINFSFLRQGKGVCKRANRPTIKPASLLLTELWQLPHRR